MILFDKHMFQMGWFNHQLDEGQKKTTKVWKGFGNLDELFNSFLPHLEKRCGWSDDISDLLSCVLFLDVNFQTCCTELQEITSNWKEKSFEPNLYDFGCLALLAFFFLGWRQLSKEV